VYINPDQFHQSFAQDLNSTEADIMSVVQKPLINQLLVKNLALQLGSSFSDMVSGV
jgi:hypothetical protein